MSVLVSHAKDEHKKLPTKKLRQFASIFGSKKDY